MVADYLFRGKEIGDESLQGISEKISSEILKNNRVKLIQQDSGLDNHHPSPIPKEKVGN